MHTACLQPMYAVQLNIGLSLVDIEIKLFGCVFGMFQLSRWRYIPLKYNLIFGTPHLQLHICRTNIGWCDCIFRFYCVEEGQGIERGGWETAWSRRINNTNSVWWTSRKREREGMWWREEAKQTKEERNGAETHSTHLTAVYVASIWGVCVHWLHIWKRPKLWEEKFQSKRTLPKHSVLPIFVCSLANKALFWHSDSKDRLELQYAMYTMSIQCIQLHLPWPSTMVILDYTQQICII